MEEILHCLLLCTVAIDQVFACASENDLSGDADLGIFFESDGGLLLVAVVEDDCDTCFCYSGLSTLIDEILTFPYQHNLASRWAGRAHTWRFCARTVVIFVIPKTKHIESRILLLPLPLSPVIELKLSSLQKHQFNAFERFVAIVYHPEITVRTAYDLKPCQH